MKSRKRLNWAGRFLSIAVCTGVLAGTAQAQTLQGEALLKALRHGGYVILMRHASSPREAPKKEAADAENVKLERQLDEEGRTSSVAMGKALRELKIPVGEVFSSPTYRALQTVGLAQLGKARTYDELGDQGQSMKDVTASQAAWLQKKVTEFPKGKNTILVTHLPNIAAAFPKLAEGLADGEALVFGPDGKGGATLVARIKIEEWPKMGRGGRVI